jgi:hypothetical protein
MKRIALALLALTGSARADDDPDERANWETGLGIHAPAVMQVGRWNAMNLAFTPVAGVRFERLAILGEIDLGTLWSANWTHGSIHTGPNEFLGGSLLRIALDVRYAFATYVGTWNKYRQRVSHQFYVDGAIGEQRVSVDGEPTTARHDFALGIGYITHIRLGRDHHFGSFYALHGTWAPGLATPDPFMTCPSCPRAGGRDIGWSFDFGLLFGG